MIQNFNNTRKTFFCFSLFFALLIGLPAKMMAQSVGVPELQGSIAKNLNASYKVEAESTTYTPLTGGTVILGSAIGNAPPGAGLENYIPLGFVFTMGCYDYDQFYLTSNGVLSLGIKGVKNSDFKVPRTLSGTVFTPQANKPGYAFLAPFWSADLKKTGHSFTYKVTGAEGSRVFTGEWTKWGWGSGGDDNSISFQVKIYEGTNVVEYIYNQEAGSFSGNAAIGIYYDVYTATPKQVGLGSVTANPIVNGNLSSAITTRPASGQLYRFLNQDEGLECTHYGQAVINVNGGVNANATDGLRVYLSGTGQMQVKRKSLGMIEHTNISTYDVTEGTTIPYKDNTAHTQGMVFSIGSTVFKGGNLAGTDLEEHNDDPNYPNKLTMVSGTRQKLILKSTNPDVYENKIRMSAVKNGLTYYFDITYTYINPDQKMRIDYSVVIPPGNTEKVQMLHGWEPFLNWTPSADDLLWNRKAWGILKGTAPDYVMGVKAGRYYEAFEYISGEKWSGYFSGWPKPGTTDSNAGFMTLTNYIAEPPAAIHRIAITTDFGNAPGTYTSSNYVVFSCAAGDDAPVLPKSTVKPCKGTIFDLNDFVTPKVLEPGVEVKWYDSNLVEIADPTQVSAGGVYYVKYYSPKYDCDSPSAKLTVTLDASCEVCVKPPVLTGTAEKVKTIISTLDRGTPRKWKTDPITGSLILESKTKGFVITRLASPTAITNPIEGMLIFDTTDKVLKLYNGTIWKPLVQACPDN